MSTITNNLMQQEDTYEFAQPDKTLSNIAGEVGEEVECTVDLPPPTVGTTSEDSDKEEDQPPPKKRKFLKPTLSWTLLTTLMTLAPIQIDQYGSMYQKYKKTKKNGKLPVEVMKHLYQILSIVGQISKLFTGSSLIQNYKSHNLAERLTTMCKDAQMKKRLREFTIAGEDPESASP